MSILSKNFTFIDLFAGIGGFHYAMNKLSEESQCVFASEIDKNAIKIYELNHKIKCGQDIRKVDPNQIPNFEVVCGGFPCQPFSKAGYQNGFNDERGNLFFEITKIISSKILAGFKPKLIVLENVRNLATHDSKNTWETIRNELDKLGYNIIDYPIIVSPADFNVPQLRDRAIILAVDRDIYSKPLEFKVKKTVSNKTIYEILDNLTNENLEDYRINEYEEKVLEAWDHFIKNLKIQTIGFPIWSDEFGLDYEIDHLPKWKQDFINKNRSLYKDNKKMIDEWKIKFNVASFIKTHRKFEWQASTKINSVFEGIIQFRPSGVRVKKPDFAPTLVAMAHVPIIGKYRRYITPNEAAKLQSIPEGFDFDSVGKDIYRLLGNAVNVDVIYNVTKQFIDYIDEKRGEMNENRI